MVATLPESEPRIMAIGREPRPLSPLKRLWGATREPILEAYKSKEPYHKVSRGTRVIAEPFLTPQDIVTGVQVWAWKPEDALSERLPPMPGCGTSTRAHVCVAPRSMVMPPERNPIR
ncbi:hypothetical protein IU493_00180 [Nocardia terpenica]|nr:hypothetical protein [Nocardia terpenica]